jgi:hypothetical protein
LRFCAFLGGESLVAELLAKIAGQDCGRVTGNSY